MHLNLRSETRMLNVTYYSVWEFGENATEHNRERVGAQTRNEDNYTS